MGSHTASIEVLWGGALGSPAEDCRMRDGTIDGRGTGGGGVSLAG